MARVDRQHFQYPSSIYDTGEREPGYQDQHYALTREVSGQQSGLLCAHTNNLLFSWRTFRIT